MQEQPALVLRATVAAAPEKIFVRRRDQARRRLRDEAARRLGPAQRSARYDLGEDEAPGGVTIVLRAFVTG